MRQYRMLYVVIIAMSSMALLSGCGGDKQYPVSESRVIAMVGDSVLTEEMVVRSMPKGLSSDDSALLFKKTVDDWVKSRVLSDFILDDPEAMARIDRLVDNYRASLLISEYVGRRNQGRIGKVSEKSIKKYYDLHKNEMLLEHPLVKGIFMRVPDNYSRLEDLRRQMAKASEKTLDKIERHGLDANTQYEYFCDRWVDWSRVEESMPLNSDNPDSLLMSGRDFMVSQGGNTYLLHISEYIKSGSVMPYDFASGQIEEILYRQKSKDYESELIGDILRDAEESGRLKIAKEYKIK